MHFLLKLSHLLFRMGQRSCIDSSPPWFDPTITTRLQETWKDVLISSRTTPCRIQKGKFGPTVCLKILLFGLIVLWKTNIKTANWRADFECYFCLWQGPAYKNTLIALKRPHSRPYLLASGDADVAINSKTTTTTCSLMGQRGTAFMDATQLSTSSFLQSC